MTPTDLGATVVPPLDEAVAESLLRGYGLGPPQVPLQIRPLTGGVSSRVLLATFGSRRWILKQPLPRFQVADEWTVDVRRGRVEFAFARTLAPRLAPGSLAPAITFAPQLGTVVFQGLPPQWTPWKPRLLAGEIEPSLADAAAHLLADLHRAGEQLALRGRFQNPDLFFQQRIDPYFRTIARRHPDLAPALKRLEEAFGARDDLVHGDFSPKNLLTDGEAVCLVDHEVATRGDAAFDVAFLLHHLALKAVHLESKRSELLDLATRFLRVYEHERASSDPGVLGRALAYLGPLLVARVDGKSPVEYLSPTSRKRVVERGRRWTLDPPRDWAEARAALTGA